MKKIAIPLLVLVLAAGILAGCGCQQEMPMATVPMTTLPTRETTNPTTRPATMPTTSPTVKPTAPRETIEDGNGPLPTSPTVVEKPAAK